jgi:hypothetical protein
MHPRLDITTRYWIRASLGIVLVCVLLLALAPVALAQEGDDGDAPGVRSPDECAACHVEAYEAWEGSHHADSLSDPIFLEAFTRAGEPIYCQGCHATGYDPIRRTVQFEGVGCLACHTEIEGEGTHPAEGGMTTDDSADLCGECHNGSHAPDYDEWLLSEHATMNIDCVDCHQSHDTALLIEDPIESCVTCHPHAADDVHGQEGMACHDCHMYASDEVVDSLSGRQAGSGHTFSIPAEVCGSCHGMTHMLQPGDEDASEADASSEALATCLEEQETQSRQSRDLGLVGGGIGGIVLGATIPWLLRRRERS